ncbi:Bug family tripartite tricarboxylate transporter substrate binding protein [Marinactinospora rubrisoli]|uniref:Bug family tripartite tricarboxylate transporter substrate binding protein n=1 Tax=Marinactinospora rubrisoli TaxID=2715399 RepID=A0ABW2KLF4_9ACTN
MAEVPNRRRALRRATPLLAAGLTLSVAACGGNLSGAQDGEYPAGPITLSVGAEPGGSTDLIARALADAAQDELGVAMPVVNTPGANGALAANQLAAEAPDGYELLVTNASLFAITPLAVSEEEAVDLADFEVITGLSRDDYVLVTAESSEYDTLDDVISAGDGLKFGTTGVGTGSQLAQELLFQQAEVSATAVPFDGGSPTMTAVLGGQVDVGAVQLGEAMPQIESGDVTPLVTFSEERNEYMADVPTAIEEGYQVRVAQYRAVVAPAETPAEVVERLRSAFENVFSDESYVSFNEENLLTPHEVAPEQVAEEWTSSLEEYREIVEEYQIDMGAQE